MKFLFFAFSLIISFNLLAQKKPLDHSVYDGWQSIGERMISNNGKWIVYISYLEDQGQSHPFGKKVKLRLMSLEDNTIVDLTDVFYGGQGTINVPSWSPDSKQVAFVTYKELK